MQIYIHRNNQQLGPFTEAEIRAQLAAGTTSLLDHVWWEGQPGWVPLGQSPFAASLNPAATPFGGTVPVSHPIAAQPPTSSLAIWALVCGCLSVICYPVTSIPAIILGHLGLSETRKNPAIQGRGLALAGMILGYIFTAISLVYFVSVAIALANVHHQVKDIFQTINVQLKAAQNANSRNSVDGSTNSPDQNVMPIDATKSPDQSTNSAPMTPGSPAAGTNSADSTPSTNAPTSATNAPPANQ